MKKYILACLFTASLSIPSYANWYEGGTLHRATAAQWQAASPANRLATASDWSAKVLGIDVVKKIGFSGLKTKSQQLSDCVTEATTGTSTNIEASEVAASCVILLRW